MELKFSHTFEENRRLNLGWKPIIFVYLAYILIMSLVVPTTSKVLAGETCHQFYLLTAFQRSFVYH